VDGAQITTLVVALLGAGGGVTVIINSLIGKANGKPARERAVNADMKTQRDDAYELADSERDRATREQKRADCAERKRGQADAYAATLHRQLVLAPCVDPGTIPPRPKYED
jgi:hypothetical protein